MVTLSTSVQADTVDNAKQADTLFLRGREALGANHFAEACELFFSAQEKQRENPAILINLGFCNEKQDKLASALRWYRKAQLLTQSKTDDTNKEYEDTARARVNALQSQVSKVTFDLGTVQPGAQLLIDGETISRQELIAEVDKGTHVVEARMVGMVTSRQPLVVDSNGKRDLTFTFSALIAAPAVARVHRRPGLRTAGWISLGVGAAAMIASGVFLARADAASDEVARALAERPVRWTDDLEDREQSGQRANTIGIVSGVVGGATLIGGAVLWWLGRSRIEEVTLAPHAGGMTAGVSLRW